MSNKSAQEARHHDAANDMCYLILLWPAHTQQSALAHHLCCHILMIARAIARTLASSYAYLCPPPPANVVPAALEQAVWEGQAERDSMKNATREHADGK